MQVGSKGGKNHLKYIMHFRLVKFQEYRQKCWCLLKLIGALPQPSFGSESGLLLLWLYDDFETRLEKASTICFSGIRKGLGWLWRICWESMSWSSVVRWEEKKGKLEGWWCPQPLQVQENSVREGGKCGIPSKLRYWLAYTMVGKRFPFKYCWFWPS